MKGNYVVKSMWIDPVIGDMQILCMKSFIAHNVDFHLYTYNEIENVPEGIIIKNANDILDSNLIFKDSKRSYATFSDWFRIKLLYDLGGWWVDCDVLLVKKFNFRVKYVFATESFYNGSVLEIRICNAVIKMPRKSEIGRRILQKINDKLSAVSGDSIKWTEIGAGFLKDEIVDAYLERYIVIPEVFCPNAWNKFDTVSKSKDLKFDNRTYAVHLWNKMWEWSKMSPLNEAIEGTLLDNAKNDFG